MERRRPRKLVTTFPQATPRAPRIKLYTHGACDAPDLARRPGNEPDVAHTASKTTKTCFGAPVAQGSVGAQTQQANHDFVPGPPPKAAAPCASDCGA